MFYPYEGYRSVYWSNSESYYLIVVPGTLDNMTCSKYSEQEEEEQAVVLVAQP